MLVLTRKPREEIRIGNGITITILRVKGQSVRVGIDAPNDVRIVRGELSPEEVVENNSTPDTSAEVETTTAAATGQRKARTASLRNRCEKSTSLHASDSTACSSRLSSPRRNGSALQAIVARNRAANAPVASPVPSPGSGPPR